MIFLSAAGLFAGLAFGRPKPAPASDSDFEFVVGKWLGDQDCGGKNSDVGLDVSTCRAEPDHPCEALYKANFSASVPTPGAFPEGGYGGARRGKSADALTLEVEAPFGTIAGQARYSKKKKSGRFWSDGLKVDGVVMQVPYGAKGTFKLTNGGAQLAYVMDVTASKGVVHCAGTLARQK